MRKIALLLVLAMLPLFSACTDETGKDLLWYQSAAAEVTGTYESTAGTWKLTLSLAAMRPDGTRDLTVRYTAPAELAGMVFRLRDGEISAVYDTLEIPISEEAGKGFFAPAELFALDGAKVQSIDRGAGEETHIRIVDGDAAWEVITDAEGIPKRITAAADGKVSAFTVTSFALTDE